MPLQIVNPNRASTPWSNASALRFFDYIIIIICLFVVPSAVVHGFLGVDEKIIFAALFPIIFLESLIRGQIAEHRRIFILFLSLTILGAFASSVSQSFSQILMALTLAVAIVVGYQLMITLSNYKALRLVTWFTLILLIGGVIGTIYSYFGGQPLLEVQVGYRTTYLYLTTFSFANTGDFIRPSGIFDEPGALVMYATIVTIFNDILNKNQRLNVAIIVLLVFVGSLAGMFVALLYLLTSNNMRIYRKSGLQWISLLFLFYIFIGYVFTSNPLDIVLDTFYTDRLHVVDGRLVGDNRSNQVEDFFTLVDEEIILRGDNVAMKYSDDNTVDMSSNPFSIIFGYGLIISLPYFALLLLLAYTTFQNRFHDSYALLGLLLLLLQRPYIYHMSWSILIAASVWLLYFSSKKSHA
jgi:MFS family permease